MTFYDKTIRAVSFNVGKYKMIVTAADCIYLLVRQGLHHSMTFDSIEPTCGRLIGLVTRPSPFVPAHIWMMVLE